MFYTNNVGTWLSKGAAEAALRQSFAQTQYASYFDVTGLVPIGSSTLNSEHVAYALEYKANSSHPLPRPSGSSQYSSIHLTAECGHGFDKIDSTPSGYDGKTVCRRIPPCTDKCYGNPITIGGVKMQEETDYAGPGLLQFKRIYKSDIQTWSHNYAYEGLDIGALEEAEYRRQFNFGCIVAIGTRTGLPICFQRTTRAFVDDPLEYIVTRPGGRTTLFKGPWLKPPVDSNDRLVRISGTDGKPLEWHVYNAQNDSTEIYNRDRKITRLTMRNGDALTFTYSDAATPATIAPTPGLLIKVTDPAGRELNFIYNGQGRLKTLIDPANEPIEYAYDEASSVLPPGVEVFGNLTSVTYQDGKRRVYWYAESNNTSGAVLPIALTGITDEEDNRYATFKYDDKFRGISTEHAGGVEKYSFTYSGSGDVTVTDPMNVTKTNYSSNVANTYRSTSENMTVNGIVVGTTTEHDSQGNVSKRRDYAGTLTTYDYDLTRNLETKRTEGSYSRTISTEWHPTERLVARVAEPKRITTFTHFPNGLINTKTVQATTDEDGASGFAATKAGTPRTWTYAYNGSGRILTITGPRTDVIDLTTFDYDTQNNLISVTNAVGHKTTLSDYDAHGRARRITDPNNVITNISYSPRGWMMQQEVKNGTLVQKTIYDRDGMGQLKRVTFPDGSYISYTYDAAHRLTDITDSVGNNVHYTLDNKGNRLEELTRDPGGALTRKITRVYNALSRLEQVTGGTQ